jgi:hypothetical protein
MSEYMTLQLFEHQLKLRSGQADEEQPRVVRTPRTRIREDAMSAIHGISSSVASSSLQAQRIAPPAVTKDKDHDGDIDKPGVVDKDKGNNVNLTA